MLYGDNNNWFAAWAFWQFKYYGHENVRIMNGGRKKWIEEKRQLTKDTPKPHGHHLQAKAPDARIRAKRDACFRGRREKTRRKLVDVRSADEFTGKIIAPPGMSETAQRGGHIPGAANIPWAQAVNEDGTFKSADAAEAALWRKDVNGDGEVIAYCRIGERSSHTWFVLKYLLGYQECAELRRLLDRMGQPDRRAHRKRSFHSRREVAWSLPRENDCAARVAKNCCDARPR